MEEQKTLQYEFTLGEAGAILKVLNKTQFSGKESAENFLHLVNKLEEPLIEALKELEATKEEAEVEPKVAEESK